ncbi:hypothetical protein [Saccharomonospora piscinae]|uniref:hypothetical protein n=1 Tax=Saccharomonospora piscinae TaxID=687388 RepID=UPI003B84562A
MIDKPTHLGGDRAGASRPTATVIDERQEVRWVSGIDDLAINLLASVIAGTAVWVFQLVRRRRRQARRRRFFGLEGGAECVIVVPRHAASPSPHSVNQLDVAAVVELAAIARECGAAVVLKVQGQNALFDGDATTATEFCVGGPDANTRMAAHLATFLPGVSMDRYADVGVALTLRVGERVFTRTPREAEYVLLAKVPGGGRGGRPLFVVCGQTAVTNRAAARYLSDNYPTLVSRYGVDSRFCLMLEIVRPPVYGGRLVRECGDLTAAAFTAAPQAPQTPQHR